MGIDLQTAGPGCSEACAGARPDLAGWAPCLKGEGVVHAGEILVLAEIGAAPSPAAGPIVPGRLLAEARKVRLVASGACMHPGVRPGDLLEISPRPVETIAVGEIAVIRRGGRFIAHRVIAKGTDDRRGPFVVTRSDRAEGPGDDGPCFDDDLLGVVDRIERAGRTVSPPRPVRGTWATMAFALSATLADARTEARWKVRAVLLRIQRTAPYRRAAAALCRPLAGRLGRELRTPLTARPGSPFFRQFAGREGIERFVTEAGEGPLEFWTLSAVTGRREAASLSFYRRPARCPLGGWWLAGGHLRARYRSTGLVERLFREAEEIFSRLGDSPPRVSLPPASPETEFWSRELVFRVTGACPPTSSSSG